jgi:hypothetical protein
MTWVDPNGIETALWGGPPFDALVGRQGAFMPEFDLLMDDVPLQAGSRLRTVKTRARQVDVPLLIRGTSASNLRSVLRSLLLTLDPNRGDGRLRVTGPDGTARELWCRYAGGLLGQEVAGAAPGHELRAVLTFQAADPFWYAASLTTSAYTLTAGGGFFPFFPLVVSATSIFTTVSVDNTGDVETWPIWSIRGPGSDIYLRNVTTGEYLAIVTTLGAGDILTIDTRPGYKTVELNGVNAFDLITPSSALWALPRGVTSVWIEIAGTTAASACTVNYYLR